jgi:hypothetical protein
MNYKPVKLPNTIDPTVRDVFESFNEAINDGFKSIEDDKRIEVSEVNGGKRIVNPDDEFILVDSRGGAVTVILPVPIVKQHVTVIREYAAANSVTIVRIDGKPTGNAGTAIAVTHESAVKLVATGSQWWKE